MSAPTPASRAIRRLSILLFLFGGWLWVRAAGYIPFTVDFFMGAILAAVGFGLWRRQGWARHLLVGAWYLVFAAAFIVPILVFVRRSYAGYEDAPMLYGLVVAGAAAFGVVAYKALGYLRSPGAVEEYGGDARQPPGTGENSHTVLIAAGGWAALFAVAYLLGLSVPEWLRSAPEPVAARAVPPPAPEPVEAPPPPPPASTTPVPDIPSADLMPLGFCFEGGKIRIVFTNRGGESPRLFRIAYGESAANLASRDHELFGAPQPGATGRADVFDVQSYYWTPDRKSFYVKLDGYEDILEVDETNNIASIDLVRNAAGGVDLPACDVVAARAADREFVPEEVARQPKIDPQPDLVPLGLCAKEQFDGAVLFNVVYTNVGNVRRPERIRIEVRDERGSWFITEGDIPLAGSLQRASLAIGPRNARRPLTVYMDAGHGVSEIDETNNARHFDTWHPDCDLLGGRLADWKREAP